MKDFSKNGVGLALLVLSLFGVNVADTDLTEVISAVGTLVSFGLMVWNQVARPDTTGFFFKK